MTVGGFMVGGFMVGGFMVGGFMVGGTDKVASRKSNIWLTSAKLIRSPVVVAWSAARQGSSG